MFARSLARCTVWRSSLNSTWQPNTKWKTNSAKIRASPPTFPVGLQLDNSRIESFDGNILDTIANDLKAKGTVFVLPGKETEAREQISKVFEKLIAYGVRPEFIVDAITQNPQLFRKIGMYPEQTMKTLEILSNFGYLTLEDAIRLFTLFSDELINYGTSEVSKNIEALSACGISTPRAIQSVIKRCPPVLFARNPNDMQRVAHEIGAFFSRRQASQLIANSPQLLLKPIEEVEKKYEYVFYQMGLEADDLCECRAWIDDMSMEEIETRHRFLLATGRFHMPDPKRPQLKMENPRLTRIIDSDEEDFACNVARVSMEEWAVFKTLRVKQQMNDNKDRPFERVKPSKRKAYERRHKERVRLDEHVFDTSTISAND